MRKVEQCLNLKGGIRDDDTILKVTIPRDVPDGKGKLHRIAVSGMGVHPRHVTRSYPASHEHGLNADSVAGVECNREQFVVNLDFDFTKYIQKFKKKLEK